jgi:target of rapamycin complex 2 subunit MAPKAP1
MIHQLRLTYLRNVEDPYASRLLSFNPRHLENAHVLAAGLADPERWPQLNMPGTPKPAPINISDSPILSRAVQSAAAKEEAAPRWTGTGGAVGGASLKYTTTIMGPTRTGMFGMRTEGRRGSNSSSSVTTEKRTRADSVPVLNVQEASATPNAAPEIRQVQNAPEASAAAQRPVIAPKFARNAEMEDRRKARIEARNALAELRAQNQAQAKAPPETKTVDAEEPNQEASSESESDSDFDVMGVAPDDELDPYVVHLPLLRHLIFSCIQRI